MSGVHDETPGTSAHTEQDSRGARPPLSPCVRPDRTARHERGSAPRSVCASGEPGGSGVTASSRSALLFRLSTTAMVAGSVRSRWRWRSWCASSSSFATCRVSANSAWSWPGFRLRRMRRIPCHRKSRPITMPAAAAPRMRPVARVALAAAAAVIAAARRRALCGPGGQGGRWRAGRRPSAGPRAPRAAGRVRSAGLSRLRTAVHCRMNSAMSACSAGGSRDVQPFQREEMRVDRGDQAGVERAEEPGPRCGISGPQGGFAGRGYAASMSLASWPVTTAVVSSSPAIALPCRSAERVPRMPMAATATTTSIRSEATTDLAAALASVRIHPTCPGSQS